MYGRRQVLGVGYPTGPGYHPGVGGYVMGPSPYVMGYARPRRYGRRQVVGQGEPIPMGDINPMAMAQAVPFPAYAPQQYMQPPGGCVPAPPGCGPQIMQADLCPMPPGYTPAMAFQQAPWRGGMLAPGMPGPGEGHVPLPLTGSAGGLFTTGGAITQTFVARPQKPYKGTRLMFIASHIPAVAGGPTTPSRVQGQIFVGTDPQQGQLGNLDLESLGAPTAFDTWLSIDQAEPGVEIQLQTALSTPLLIVGESILVNAYLIGHWVS